MSAPPSARRDLDGDGFLRDALAGEAIALAHEVGSELDFVRMIVGGGGRPARNLTGTTCTGRARRMSR